MSDYGTADEGLTSDEYLSVSEGYPGTPSISNERSGEGTPSIPGIVSPSSINLEEPGIVSPSSINLEEEEPDIEDLYDFFCHDQYLNRGIVNLQEVQKANTYLSPDGNKLLYGSDKGEFEYKSNSIRAGQCPGFFEYDGYPLNIVDYISSGSFGYVIRLSSETELPSGLFEVTGEHGEVLYSASQLFDPKTKILSERPRRPEDTFYSVVVKVFKKEGDSEIGNIRWLGKINQSNFCDTINISLKSAVNPYVGDKENIIALMDTMDGNLNDYARQLPSLLELNPHVGENTLDINPFHLMEVIVDITRKLADSLYCLKRNKIGYSDLKAENILYKCSMGKMVVSLGDIGSLCKITGSAACTYPPCDFTMEEKSPGLCAESSMVWGLGVIFLQLIQYPRKKTVFSSSKKLFPLEGLKEIFYHGNYKRNVALGDKYYGMVFQELKKISHNYKLSSYIVQVGEEQYQLSHILQIMFNKNSVDRMDKLRYLKDMYLVN